MRQNLRDVLTAWQNGRQRNRARVGYNSIWTDGRSIYSYNVEILRVVGSCLYLNVASYSRTTSTHRNALRRFFDYPTPGAALARHADAFRECYGPPSTHADPQRRDIWTGRAARSSATTSTTASTPAVSSMGPIRPYHSSPRSRCLPSPFTRAYGSRKYGDGGRFFGVELEVERRVGTQESRGEIAQRIHDWVNNQAQDITAEAHRDKLVQFEQDGSLTDGFEMITAPMGLDDHGKMWKTALSPSLVKGLRSHDTTTCGLHVHISRAGMTPLQISKMVCFVNDPDNADLITAVARRYTRGQVEGTRAYGEWANTYPKRMASAYRNRSGFKYQAVNLCNDHTIEFRIFRGTLKYTAVMAAIEFTNAVADFCNVTGMDGYNLKTPAFLDFINTAAMRKHTRHLRAYLADRYTSTPLPARFRPAGM